VPFDRFKGAFSVALPVPFCCPGARLPVVSAFKNAWKVGWIECWAEFRENLFAPILELSVLVLISTYSD